MSGLHMVEIESKIKINSRRRWLFRNPLMLFLHKTESLSKATIGRISMAKWQILFASTLDFFT